MKNRKQGSLKICNRLLCGTAREELHTCSFESHSAGFTANGESQFDSFPFLARFFDTSFSSHQLLCGTRGFSSQAGTDLEDSAASDKIPGSMAVDDSDDELISRPEVSADDAIEIDGTRELLDLCDAEDDVVKKSEGKGESSGFLMSILASSMSSIPQIVENWVEQGNEISRSEYLFAMIHLRSRRLYVMALQLSEWWMVNKGDFNERDYATHVDLIAKLRGLEEAEYFIGKIPEGFRKERVYQKLLANSVSQRNLKKSEEVFNKMKKLGFPITCSTYEQLLILYKRFNKKKLADVLLLMHQENVKPTPFAYMQLIDAKGQSNDIVGMDKFVEIMKNDGVELNFRTLAKMAWHYISAGLQDKAEGVLKQMEESNEKEKRGVLLLLPLYAALGKADDVKRIWSKCESNPRLADCEAAINAWVKLQRIDEAEAVFDRMTNKFEKLPLRSYATMLRVYANNKMLSKGKDLIKQMVVNGYQIGIPLLWDPLVKLYVEAGELHKAVDVLHKATKQSRLKPKCSCYTVIMDEYAKKGDVHNAEKVLRMMRQAGY